MTSSLPPQVVDSSKADLDIIFYLISLILDCQQPDGSVLVFLPSYDDITRLRLDLVWILWKFTQRLNTKLTEGTIAVPSPTLIIHKTWTFRRSMLMQDQNMLHKIHIFMLHSSMQPFEQRKVFRKSPYGIRKVTMTLNLCIISRVQFTIEKVACWTKP